MPSPKKYVSSRKSASKAHARKASTPKKEGRKKATQPKGRSAPKRTPARKSASAANLKRKTTSRAGKRKGIAVSPLSKPAKRRGKRIRWNSRVTVQLFDNTIAPKWSTRRRKTTAALE